MAKITINIPEGKAQAVIDALCTVNGYTDNSSLSKPQFAKKMILDFIKSAYVTYKKETIQVTRKQIEKDALDYVNDLDVS